MKIKWLGTFLFVGMIAGFVSCYCPHGYHGYSDYYGYGPGYYGQGKYNGYHGYPGYYGHGPSYYGHGEYMRRDQGHAYPRAQRSYSRHSYYTSQARTAKR